MTSALRDTHKKKVANAKKLQEKFLDFFFGLQIKHCPHEYADLSATSHSQRRVISDPTTSETWENSGEPRTQIQRSEEVQELCTKV